MTPKIAAEEPIPSARVSTAIRAKPGFFASMRMLQKKSCRRVPMDGLQARKKPSNRSIGDPGARECDDGPC
jgi:hypothetical protein